jgi:hypothetical protein
MFLFYLKYLFTLYFSRIWLTIMLEGTSKSLKCWGGAWSKKGWETLVYALDRPATVIGILYTTNCKYGEGIKFCVYLCVCYHPTVINYAQILIRLNGSDMHEDMIKTE